MSEGGESIKERGEVREHVELGLGREADTWRQYRIPVIERTCGRLFKRVGRRFAI